MLTCLFVCLLFLYFHYILFFFFICFLFFIFFFFFFSSRRRHTRLTYDWSSDVCSSDLGPMASVGIVSAVGGPLRTGRGGLLEQFIRTDATPYPGFSGGPLIDSDRKSVV